jgi:hypothetical protein
MFLIIWSIRLEAKVMYLEKDHEAHKVIVSEKDKLLWAKWDDLQKTLNLVLQAIGELKGKIDNTFRVWTFYCFQKWYISNYKV